MNYNVVALIHQNLTYKKMSSDAVIGRIMNHEMNIQEANNIKNLYKVLVSQPLRNKILLSKQIKASRKKF
jgi:hypothetical protein